MGFLKYVDVLIGLAVVMVLLSPLVTAITQAIMLLFDMRAQFLAGALEKLISAVDPTSLKDVAWQLADAVLHHPMIAKGNKMRRGQVVEREELIRVLLELAAGEFAFKDGAAPKGLARILTVNFSLPSATLASLRSALTLNGVIDPKGALAKIRAASLDKELKDPNAAAHERETAAIIESVPSDFVAKINNWFDRSMSRVTQRYALWARVVTVAGAMVVIACTQLDSFHLLNRLSADDSFRKSLVDEAARQKERIDSAAKAPPKGSDNDAKATQDGPDREKERSEITVDEAQARLSQIDHELDALRAPEMAIIPDHFLWQKIPVAILMDNPEWRRPYPARFELILGNTSYTILPAWKQDPLNDIAIAIQASGAPVDVKIERPDSDTEILLRGDNVSTVSLLDGTTNLLTYEDSVAQARLENDGWFDEWDKESPPELILGYKRYELAVKVAKKDQALGEIRKALKSQEELNDAANGLTFTEDGPLELTARDPQVRWIELRYTKSNNKGIGNALSETTLIGRAARVSYGRLSKELPANITISGAACKAEPFVLHDVKDMPALKTKIESCAGDKIAVGVHPGEKLILTSHRLGGVELRYKQGLAETNILNRHLELKRDSPSIASLPWGGLILSWALLSLGAPFWYDALKDLLKLRPALAGKEEEERNDRLEENPPAAKKS